ncbi:uncharacterized protein L3040_006252 [Drepanopeziza brunnea f. sp. 'multigermtubi']|uniref:uncharacterized protein n=1 Tax=Drepanopeziza brunnea f. sp. 'multigermtubi' TaxID=698441 RepID=UPI00238B6A6A|nr:hypothetical protein L3040_006252 [Drepanopeziza brunnea f. sp. 'multigermtubi']
MRSGNHTGLSLTHSGALQSNRGSLPKGFRFQERVALRRSCNSQGGDYCAAPWRCWRFDGSLPSPIVNLHSF